MLFRSDVIVCDYNYLFDPVVHLQRFFDAKGDHLFLIDEAHNLPGRARDMHSAGLCKSDLLAARRALGSGKSRLKTALQQANDLLLQYRKALTEPDAALLDLSDPGQQTSLFAADDVSPPPTAAEMPFAGLLPLAQYQRTRYYKDLPKIGRAHV